MKGNLLALLVYCVWGLASDGRAADADAYYDLHIIAVDRDGSALRPGVRHEKGKFKAKPNFAFTEKRYWEPEKKRVPISRQRK